MSKLAPLFALLVLTACGKADNEPGPGGVTMGEARALDEAAEMIEAQRLPPEAIPPVGQSGPVAAPTASNSAKAPAKTPG
jgi:hypothetical protein